MREEKEDDSYIGLRDSSQLIIFFPDHIFINLTHVLSNYSFIKEVIRDVSHSYMEEQKVRENIKILRLIYYIYFFKREEEKGGI